MSCDKRELPNGRPRTRPILVRFPGPQEWRKWCAVFISCQVLSSEKLCSLCAGSHQNRWGGRQSHRQDIEVSLRHDSTSEQFIFLFQRTFSNTKIKGNRQTKSHLSCQSKTNMHCMSVHAGYSWKTDFLPVFGTTICSLIQWHSCTSTIST